MSGHNLFSRFSVQGDASALYFGQDFLAALSPDVPAGSEISLRQIRVDGRHQFADTLKTSVANAINRQVPEKPGRQY